MTYRVIWLPEAIDRLAWAYLNAREDSRANAFTRATEAVEKKLTIDPHGCSESRGNNSRIMTELP